MKIYQLEILAQIFPFLKNNKLLVSEFAQLGFYKTFSAHSSVYTEGDHCHQIVFVLKGEIRIFKAHESGRQITLYEIGPGDTCILNASCILSNIGYPANASCMMNTEVLLLPAAIFKKLLDAYPEFQTYVYTMLSYRLTTVITLLEEVIFNRLDIRLFDYLVEHSDGGILSRTHQSIANDLGTSREVVSRLLKDLQEKETIRRSRNHIQILDFQPDHLQNSR